MTTDSEVREPTLLFPRYRSRVGEESELPIEEQIISVRDASAYVRKGPAKRYREAAEYLCDPVNDVLGSPESFFGLIGLYKRAGDYRDGGKIAERALDLYPGDSDLLSCAISCHASCGERELAYAWIDRACELPMNIWTPQLFDAVINALQTVASSLQGMEGDEVMDHAIKLAQDYQSAFPYDEAGYEKEADLHLLCGDAEAARAVLEAAVMGSEPAPKGLLAPRCCVVMLDSLLNTSDDYDEIIRIANRGLAFSAQEQPGASVGYLLYRIALANDALFYLKEEELDNRPEDDLPADVEIRELDVCAVRALRAYQQAYAALRAEDRHPSYISTVEARFAVIRARRRLIDFDLDHID